MKKGRENMIRNIRMKDSGTESNPSASIILKMGLAD
jgi:hypothetical protein